MTGSLHIKNDALSLRRSLNQQLVLVETILESISQWQDTVQNQLNAYIFGRVSIERKLDLVREMHTSLIRSSRRKEVITYEKETSYNREGNLPEGICATLVNGSVIVWQAPLGRKKTSSDSSPSAS